MGQLSCQGLNRALALGAVLKKDFGKPDVIFAPDPAVQKADSGRMYDYVRPLATIEPAAIAFGLPVDASIGVMDIKALQTAVDAPTLRNALVFVAWEHKQLVTFARLLLQANGGNAADVPDWSHKDFDSIYVVRIERDGGASSAAFRRLQENLNGLATTCTGNSFP